MGFLIMGVIGYIVKLSMSKSSLLSHFRSLGGNIEEWWSCKREQVEGKEGGHGASEPRDLLSCTAS
jgi:hypothetical protein